MFGADPEAEIGADASAHLHKFNFERDAALFIRLDEPGFRAASFLDDRILTAETKGSWLPIARAVGAAQRVQQQRPLHFIFHSGHVGSTLISRLLDEVPGTLPLREPQTLRQLAQASDNPENKAALEILLDAQLKLWRRGFPGTQRIVLKATSSAARLAERLLSTLPDSRGIFINLRPEPYLATHLAGANTPTDLRGMGAERLKRLSTLTTAPLPAMEALSLGELAAMTWLVETLTHARARAAFPQRTLALDFHDFLDAPGASIGRIAQHFGAPWSPDLERRIPQSPAFARYSKAPEHQYSPALRQAVLNQARAMHAAEIRKGLRWLAVTTAADPALSDMFPDH